MAFELLYRCENCHRAQWALERPEEWSCPCYIPEEAKYEGTGLEQPIGKTERKARYREQYRLDSYSWNETQPPMFMGEFETYPDRRNNETL